MVGLLNTALEISHLIFLADMKEVGLLQAVTPPLRMYL
jgi:hypothetical protein